MVDAAHALHARDRLEPANEPLEQACDMASPAVGRPDGLFRREPGVHDDRTVRAVARIFVEQVEDATSNEAGADQQHNRQRDLRHDEAGAESAGRGAPALNTLTVRQRIAWLAPRCPKRRDHADDSGCEQRDRQGKHEHAQVHADLSRTRQTRRVLCEQRWNARERQCRAEAGARDREHQRLGQETPSNATGAGSEGEAQGGLTIARQRPSEHEIRHVHAGDEQQHA